MKKQATEWLWHNRKTLITAVLFAAVLELVYFLPFYLVWWLLLGTVVLGLGAWWHVGLSRDWKTWWGLPAELLWLAAAGVGFAVFSLVGLWQYHAAMLILMIVLFRVLMLYQQFWESEENWPVQAFSFLNFLDLVAFFLVSGLLMTIADFYNLQLWVIMLVFGMQILLAVYLRFWREGGGMTLRRWFYALVTLLVLEEVLWVLSSWHRGVFFKSFLITVLFYAFVDFIMHYTKGTLTVKVVVEYAFLILILLVAIFLFDWLFILQ
ncbi:MAG: hypothetical protein PHR51_02030 [Patescibacteria group bacterium]|nr:hypothetical protein [Patescibacteria group bacterium]